MRLTNTRTNSKNKTNRFLKTCVFFLQLSIRTDSCVVNSQTRNNKWITCSDKMTRDWSTDRVAPFCLTKPKIEFQLIVKLVKTLLFWVTHSALWVSVFRQHNEFSAKTCLETTATNWEAAFRRSAGGAQSGKISSQVQIPTKEQRDERKLSPT